MRIAIMRVSGVLTVLLVLFVTSVAVPAFAQSGSPQWTAMKRGSDNIEVVAHLPLGPRLSVADIDIEQELDRPYA